MKLLTSKKFKLPTIFFISDREEIEEVPVGIPYIFGDPGVEEHMVRLLEYEILYESAVRSGYPFNFRKILKDNGYKTQKFWFSEPAYIEYTSDDDITQRPLSKPDLSRPTVIGDPLFRKFITDTAAYVDINKLKGLNIFPTWLDEVEQAISVNINAFALFNPHMYNKKLDGMYGSVSLSSPPRNLIIIDISGSIPKAVSTTCLALAKNLSESFYADLVITGSKSTLYEYENVADLNVETIYEENGMDNDQVYFRKLLTEKERSYDAAIVFGDNHQPGQKWYNDYNKGSVTISEADGKKECKWTVKKVVSLHTTNNTQVAGYGLWFSPDDIQHIDGWVKYLK